MNKITGYKAMLSGFVDNFMHYYVFMLCWVNFIIFYSFQFQEKALFVICFFFYSFWFCFFFCCVLIFRWAKNSIHTVGCHWDRLQLERIASFSNARNWIKHFSQECQRGSDRESARFRWKSGQNIMRQIIPWFIYILAVLSFFLPLGFLVWILKILVDDDDVIGGLGKPKRQGTIDKAWPDLRWQKHRHTTPTQCRFVSLCVSLCVYDKDSLPQLS